MTQPANQSDGATDEDVDEQLDNEGDRDPLSTDDGLTEVAAAGMPEVEDRETRPGEDAQPISARPPLDSPELDVADDGTDPCAGFGHIDTDPGLDGNGDEGD